ncbi:MAG: hypothetical protein KC481_05755 [Acidimicrobiaceae bacterium]|nr:hypothetical protein [Acidimicrobiaceae bacterium]MCO4833145.1 hypothetical protein [Acidimicrobiaceae bacterium]MDB4818010.1 hypothetical protein [Acidimicrobiales bacterium]MDC1389275.1 hypothetical protein [Acidimicrobiales bacterium]
MTEPATESLSKRTLAGRIIGGLWAANFVLLVTETFTFNGQSQLSFALAIGAMGLLFQR